MPEVIVDNKKCGCCYTWTFEDDPDFQGYDSDRESCVTRLCGAHKVELRELQSETDGLEKQIALLSQRLKETRHRVRVIQQDNIRAVDVVVE